MAEKAAIQMAIEKLDSWLAKERCILRDDLEKELDSNRRMEFWKDNMEKKAKAYQRCIIEKADLGSLEVGMPELGEDNKDFLYSYLVIVAGSLKNMKGGAFEKNDMCSWMLEVADLWEYDDEGNIYKQKLHSVLVQMAKSWVSYDESLYNLIVEMAGVWKDSKGQLSKEKLNSWLPNKADLGDYNMLLHLLLEFTDPDVHLGTMSRHTNIEKSVEKVRDHELKQMLDIITNMELRLEETVCKRLHYLISDALEMAHHAHLLLHAKDSDPFILLLQIFSCFNEQLRNTHYSLNPLNLLTEKIVFIQKCIQETKDRMLKFGVERQMDPREELVDPTHSDVVGLDEDVELLLGIQQTICIKGIPGIGKTTLARQLYNHKSMVDQYKSRAWIDLSSREISRKEILIKLFRQLQVFERVDMLLEKMDVTRLREMLSQHLQQSKRVFIVLDHVSQDAYFKYILDILPKDKGNRLLFTTRSPTLNCTPFEVYDHMMKYLDDEKSWQLLSKTAFSGISNEEFPKQLKGNGRLILRKCGGLPLAIKEVGRQWAEKRRFGSRWEQIVEESSIDLDLRSTLEALESTYHNLSPELKLCFLYLGLFKEGATIKGKKIVHVWTAGGVVANAKIEEANIDHLLRLSEHSIIEVDMCSNTHRIKIKTFRINAVFQRLSIKMAEDEIGLDILRKDGNNRSSREPRHRVIHCSREKLNFINYSSINQSQDKHLVSLFFHGGGYFDDNPSYWNNFEQLKILDMEGFGLKILPETIGELSELRYLGLKNNYIEELPCSLGRLKNLEVLDIEENFMVELDVDIICKMDNLCHLYMSNITCRKPLKINALKNLKTLTYIPVDNWAYEVSRLKMMTSLNKLGIEELDENSDVSKLFASLSKLKGLKCLILRGFRFRRMPSLDNISLLQNLEELKLEGLLTRLPSADTFPSKLKILSLVKSCLHEDPMPILEKLPRLMYLKLQNAYTGQQMVISSNGFPWLNYLVVGELWQLRNLQIKEGAMMHLSKLEIYSCPYQENPLIDIGVRYYNLRELKIVTTKNIATKIRADPRLKNYKKVDIQP